tara:strand:- start:2329 stop:2496 length:168 start_codon:yes stop_codon:yes gene_type:complete
LQATERWIEGLEAQVPQVGNVAPDFNTERPGEARPAGRLGPPVYVPDDRLILSFG